MQRRIWVAVTLGLCFSGGAGGEAAISQDQLETSLSYAEQLSKGIEAVQHGLLSEAARTFQEAYLIRPNDPTLRSWMTLVNDERMRRDAIDHPEKKEVQRQLASAERDDALAASPLQDRIAVPDPPASSSTPLVGPDSQGRPEILGEPKRAGYQRLYKEGIGFQPVPGLGFSGRTEIFDEPNPVDDFVLEAKILNLDDLGEYRNSILPLFTRSWAGRVVADYEPFPRLTYEYDERTILHELETRFAVKDRHLRTHAFNALYTFPRVPLLGLLTVNPWYKRVLQDAKSDIGSLEHKDELVFNLSLQPVDTTEYFFQYNTYEARKTRTAGGSKLQLFKGQVRWRFPSLKLFAIPSVEYSRTTYDPGDDEFTKRDYFVDWGFDVTPRLRASSKERLVMTELTRAGSSPSNPTAETYSAENTLSYELFKDFDVSLGVDYARAAGMNAYNNVGLRAEIELFKPGLIRSKLGYERLFYYNIDDGLSLLYWRFFLFQ